MTNQPEHSKDSGFIFR